MLLENPIGWCDDTGNIVIGCDKYSEGCKNCYAENDTPARVLRAGKWPGYEGQKIETWGPKGQRIPIQSFKQKVRRLNKLCICDTCRHTADIASLDIGRCRTAFCPGPLRRIRFFPNSNSDWLDEKWPIETFAAFLKVIHDHPNVDFLTLTKRTDPKKWRERMMAVLKPITDGSGQNAEFWQFLVNWLGGRPPHNLWLGTSIENQKAADERLPELFQIPARLRWLSCEPLLEPIEIADDLEDLVDGGYVPGSNPVHWVVAGGESSQPKRPARPCHIDWLRSLAEQCASAVVPFYCKQLGSNCVEDWSHEIPSTPDERLIEAVKAVNPHADIDAAAWEHHRHNVPRRMKHPAGADLSEWPAYLRIRQFPNLTPAS